MASFGNDTENKASVTESEQEKISLDRIRSLGIKIAAAEDQLKTYNDLTGAIEQKKAEHETLQKSATDLSVTEASINKSIATLTATHDTLVTTHSTLTDTHTVLAAQVPILEKNIADLSDKEQKSQEALTLAVGNQEQFKIQKDKEISDIDLKIKDKTAEHVIILAKVSEAEASLEKTKASEKESSENVVKNTSILSVLKTEISSLFGKPDALRLELSEIQKKHDDEIKQKDTELSGRIMVVEKREGDVSVKESWLQSKTDDLRKFKSELEKHFNRKIDINI